MFLEILALNSSEPLKIVLEQTTNWKQYSISIVIALISSFFVFYMMWDSFLKEEFSKILAKFMIRRIKKATGRNIILIKHTNRELFSSSMIDQKTLQDIIKHMNKLNGKPFDLILYTPGGEIFSSLYISRLIKEYPSEVRAIVPIYSMSGGTLLALSADKLLLGSNGCLGPVDPQLGSLFSYGSSKSWNHIVNYKKKKAEDSSIAMALTGKQYTKSINKHIYSLLENKMSNKDAKEFSNFLTNGDIEHAYPINASLLKSKNYPVQVIPKELEKKLTKVLISPISDGVYRI